MTKGLDVDLITIGGGAAIDMFADRLPAILENLRDPNTPPGESRKIVLTIEFSTDEERQRVLTKVDLKMKLAGINPVATQVFLGKRDGELVAVHFDPVQRGLFDDESEEKKSDVLPITGT